MLKSLLVWTGIALLAQPLIVAAQQSTDHPGSPAEYRDTFNRYCVTCHNNVVERAGLSLEDIDVGRVGQEAATWEKVLRKLKGKAMPPTGMPRPDAATYDAIAGYLEVELDQYADANPRPGSPAMRRLNRTEYMNAVRELFAMRNINGGDELLPPDNTMFGFDNVGNALTLSPLQVERYVKAARVIRKQVLGDPEMQPEFYEYKMARYQMQDDRENEDMPFGSRGGLAVEHHFPVDGEYVIDIELQRNSRDYIRGLVNRPHLLDIRVDGERVKEFTVGGEHHGKSSGIFSSSAQGDIEEEHYERFSDEKLEVRFPVKAGTRKVTVSFVKEMVMPEGPRTSRMSIIDYNQYKSGLPGIDTVTVGGPYNGSVSDDMASRQKVFVCKPQGSDDVACAREILSSLAHRAYRRPPMDAEIAELMGFYRQGQADGGFDEGIGMAIERILAGPEFLFVMEQPPADVAPGQVYRIPDLDLATRLSLFLWSSIPDEELLTTAESGRLGNPEVLQQQVRRMLDDPKSRALVENFASHWLTLPGLKVAAPDGELFPYFDDDLKLAYEKETKLLFEYILENDRPLIELLNADYTFVNQRLAEQYNIPGIYGSHFRKIQTDETRGGILGQGSILTVTSYPNRTAPTIRGKWILENILGTPPPPPPPNVPGLRETNDRGEVLNMRQRMEQHRANPVCASCHKIMDPLGFAIERYDAIGKWRTVYASNNTDINATGTLPDGTPFEGPIELKQVLSKERQRDYMLTVVEKMLTYALGREINHTDAPAMRSIMEKARADDYRLSSLIMAIIESKPFLNRRVSSNEDIQTAYH